ncbi:MAG: DUF3048 domain-containing protein [Candidatus Nanosyncoccaceae bacterium]|jgi:hypothetical protein
MALRKVQSYQPELEKKKEREEREVNKKPYFFVRHWVGLVIIIASFVATSVLITLLTSVEFTSPTFVRKIKPPVYYASLSGLEVETEAETNRPITAIMIPNDNYGARPQSGIGQAELVFEAVAEGGITRFMALYQKNQPSLVGPIRSVRPYFLYWVEPFEASIAQTGASARANQELRSGRYRDIGFDHNSKYFWRDRSRRAPNNVYTNFEKINQLNQSKGYGSSNPDMFLRQKSKAVEEPNATQINLKISRSAIYNSYYTYDTNTNKYTRHQNGAVHSDRESGPIQSDVVIALRVIENRVLEDGYRENIEVIGEGKVYIFQNGTVIEATWKKPEHKKQIRFYDNDGKEIAINRGHVWITAIPNNVGDVSWQ